MKPTQTYTEFTVPYAFVGFAVLLFNTPIAQTDRSVLFEIRRAAGPTAC